MVGSMIYLIGAGIAGNEGISDRAQQAIAESHVLVGRQHHLDRFPGFAGEKMLLDELPPLLAFLQSAQKPVAVLATGDPNFFGTGRFLLRNLPKERLEIFANVTSMQYAFARIKEPWDDAIFLSLQGRGMGPSIDRILAAEKACILTDQVNTPSAVAKELLERGVEGYQAWLCEDMGMPTEKFTRTSIKGLLTLKHSELNILILIRTWEQHLPQYPLIGIDDHQFASIKKHFTHQEVRAVTLAKLKLQNDLIVWDIGAGSGSISIEASNLLPAGRLFAIEKNRLYLPLLRQNLEKFCARNVKPVEAEAPQGLDELPDPDRVFIGGAGGNLEGIVEHISRRLKKDGLVVINAITLDTLSKSIEALEYNGYQLEVTCINISRTRPESEFRLFEAQDPVYIITAWKQG